MTRGEEVRRASEADADELLIVQTQEKWASVR